MSCLHCDSDWHSSAFCPDNGGSCNACGSKFVCYCEMHAEFGLLTVAFKSFVKVLSEKYDVVNLTYLDVQNAQEKVKHGVMKSSEAFIALKKLAKPSSYAAEQQAWSMYDSCSCFDCIQKIIHHAHKHGLSSIVEYMHEVTPYDVCEKTA